MEQGAFLPFYEQHKETLYHYACTLTANAHQAEDALQTAWLSCLRQEETFEMKGRRRPSAQANGIAGSGGLPYTI